jgi:hypothetical protein
MGTWREFSDLHCLRLISRTTAYDIKVKHDLKVKHNLKENSTKSFYVAVLSSFYARLKET